MKLERGLTRPKRSWDFRYYHFRMSCPGLWTAVETWRGAIQLCPDRHPAVSSMTLWGSIQNYPACPVAPRFADVAYTTSEANAVVVSYTYAINNLKCDVL
jgi:hypothetical protein